MVDRSASLKKIADVKYYASALFEVIVSIGDTITLAEFDTTVNLSNATLMNNSDGSEITCTVLLNVVTVTGAATDEECTLFVFGRRA